jgi:hypothetical protein
MESFDVLLILYQIDIRKLKTVVSSDPQSCSFHTQAVPNRAL